MKHRTTMVAASAAAAMLLLAPLASFAQQEVTLYTTREQGLIQPLLGAFTADTGIKVNTVYLKDGLLERVKAEGERSPADVLMAVDIGALVDLAEGGVTQPVRSTALESAIPANLRAADGRWFALSMRERVLYTAASSPITTFRYEDLADPKYKGKVCIRAGQHPYNTALVASMIAHDGAEATEKWLRGVKANLARKAAGGDRDVARDIVGGICEVGIANSYYVGQMKNSAAGTDARKWGDGMKAIRPVFGNAKSGGTHVNISGAAVARNAPNQANAVKLIEYLVSEKAQAMYARGNYETPIRAGVKGDESVNFAGALKVDPLPVAEIAKYRKQASQLVDKVGFDQ